MADIQAELSDAQIEQFLSEAQSRLASRAGASEVAGTLNGTSINLVPRAPVVDGGVQPAKPLRSRSLSLRTPPQAINKKKSKNAKEDSGSDWFNMPKADTNDKDLKRDLQVLQNRSILDPHQHWKKDNKKKLMPDFCQVGRIIEGRTEHFSNRLTRKERKRTMVEEVLAARETNAKFKNRYDEIQERKSSGKKAHYKRLLSKRRRG